MPERRVYFYRVYLGRDDNLRPIPFDAKQALTEVDQLSFFDEDNGRYIDVGEGDLACCWVDRLRSPQRVRVARSRRSHLPPVERAGELTELNIPDDAGLAEQTFLVFFADNIVGAVYSSFSPRVSLMRKYVQARCGDEYKAIDFEPLLRQDVAEKLQSLAEVRVLDLKIHRAYAASLHDAAPSLARAVQQLGDLAHAQQISITLKPEPYSRGWLDSAVLQPIRRLARRRDLREGVDTFKVKGLNRVTGRLDEIDVLKDQLVVSRDVTFADSRSAALDTASAYRAIEDAYAELRPHLELAAGAR
jgi:hypothetical protein